VPASHIALVLLVNALWGFNFVAAREGTLAFEPLTFITLRFAIVLVLLLPFLRIVPGRTRQMLVIGLTMGVGHYAFMFYAIWLADSLASVAIAAQTTVPIATLLAILFLGERIRWPRALAIAASFAGVVVIVGAPAGPAGPGTAGDGAGTVAVLLTLVAAAAMAVATILMRRLEGVATFTLQAWIALAATLSCGAITFAVESPDLATLAAVPLASWWTPVYSAIGATIIGHGTLYWLLQRHPVNAVAPFITLSTLFAIGFGIVLLDDALTPRIVIGGLLTLAGVTVVAMRNARRDGAPSAPRPVPGARVAAGGPAQKK